MPRCSLLAADAASLAGVTNPNPPCAHEALQAELEIGLALPCNVVVYEDGAGRAVVLAIDPPKTVAASGHAKLGEVEEAVKDKLGRALARLE